MAAAPPGVRHRPHRDRRARVCALTCIAAAAVFTSPGRAAGGSDVQGLALAGGRPAPNAVVWLEAPTAPRTGQQNRVVLDQRSLRFSPRVLAVRVGTSVTFPNNDRVFHNVFSFHHGKVFDLGLYPVGTSKDVHFDRPGVSRIFCNIHPNMAAYVFVVDSPYFAVSDDAGRFTLDGVPPGTYTYRAWRPGAADVSGTWTVTVPEGAATLRVEWAQ